MTNDNRLEYTRPELLHYGAITRLVQAGSGVTSDGMAGMMM